MHPLFSPEARRNPYPLYAQLRQASPVCRIPGSRLWMLLDYESVKRALSDHEAFGSRLGPAEWMIFLDPPRHSKLRALVSQAFTPRSISALEPRIRGLACDLLDRALASSPFDLAEGFSIPLPMLVIAQMLGAPGADQPQFRRWNEILLNMSYTVGGGEQSAGAAKDFSTATVEMAEYLAGLLAARQAAPTDDLLSRLAEAEVDGERLTPQDILGFFQLLLLAGSETTTNLLNNAALCFIENPAQLADLRAAPELLPSAIEEVLRFRSPLQWMLRVTRQDVQMHGQSIPAGNVVLAVMGSANRDPKQFPEAERFDIRRHPNPHVAFGHGIHSCLGAALARLESKIALSEFLSRAKAFSLATTEPWEPRQGLHVHGPNRLPLCIHWNNQPVPEH